MKSPKLNLRQKLAVWTGVSVSWILLLAVVGYAFYHRIATADAAKDALLKKTLTKQSELQDLVKLAQDTRIIEKRYLEERDTDTRAALDQQLNRLRQAGNVHRDLPAVSAAISTYSKRLDELENAHKARTAAGDELRRLLQRIIRNVEGMLQVIQAERQKEGGDLSEDERELMSSGQQAVILALQMQDALQRYLLSPSTDNRSELESLMADDDSLILDSLVTFSKLVEVDGIAESAAQVPAAMQAFRSSVRDVSVNFVKEQQARDRLDDAGSKVLKEIQGKAKELTTGVSTKVDLAETTAVTTRQQAAYWLIVIVVLGTLLFIVAAQITRNSILQPVNAAAQLAAIIQRGDVTGRITNTPPGELGRLCDALNRMAEGLEAKAALAEAIADGDLSVKTQIASEYDVLGLALRDMTGSLNQIMGRVRTVADEVGIGADQIYAASGELSAGAADQAASLEQIAAALQEMSGETRNNAENANEADELASSARGVAQAGNSKMEDLAVAMHEIQTASKQISKIIKVINDIAFQTNLLALNAAVEAARAGRHGRGFGVVAQEIRQLAVRSADAAKETADLINTAHQKVGNGVELASETGGYLGEIVAQAIRVSDLVTQIAASSTKQAEGIGQINQGLTQVGSITQANTAHAEETTTSATQLANQANRLLELLDQFQLATDAEYSSDEPAGDDFEGSRFSDETWPQSRQDLPDAGDAEETEMDKAGTSEDDRINRKHGKPVPEYEHSNDLTDQEAINMESDEEV